jgi:hypothetical protein
MCRKPEDLAKSRGMKNHSGWLILRNAAFFDHEKCRKGWLQHFGFEPW